MPDVLPAAVALLRALWPSQDFPDDSVRAYVRLLADVPDEPLRDAVDTLGRTSKFRPSVAEIRELVALKALRLPSAGEAWAMANDPESFSGEWPDVLTDTVRAVGGRYAIRITENPTTMRAQFNRDYLDRVKALVSGTAAADTALPALEAPRRPRPALPVSDAVTPGPVMRRIQEGRIGDPPTEEEKRNAIEILRLPDIADAFEETARCRVEALSILDRWGQGGTADSGWDEPGGYCTDHGRYDPAASCPGCAAE